MRLFWIGFGISFIVSLGFPLAIWLSLPRETRPARWIQNCSPFSVFMLSAFPTAIGILTVTFFGLKAANVFAIASYGESWMFLVAMGSLLFILAFASVIVLNDFTSRPVAPYILKKSVAMEAFRLEKELRDAAKANQNLPEQATPEQEAEYDRYRKLVQLDSLEAIFKRGNLVVLAYLGIAWAASMCCVFYFWYVAVLVLTNQTLPGKTPNKLLMVFILLVTWFPMRVHMDWYQNYFHSHTWLRDSHGFWLCIILAIASLFFVIFIINPDALVIFCTAFNTSVLAFIGLTGKFKPLWLRAVGDFLQAIPFTYFVAAYTIFLFVTAVIGLRVLRVD
jgi:hypothetical protein